MEWIHGIKFLGFPQAPIHTTEKKHTFKIGIDGLPTEIIQEVGENCIRCLQRIFNAAWTRLTAPIDWEQAINNNVKK